MKTKLFSPAALFTTLGLLATASFVYAADEKPKGPPEGRPNREEMLKRFDANGDGKLDDTERQTMRAEMEKEHPKAAKKAQAAGGEMRDRALARFDKDGDGMLNDAERAEADATMRAEMAKRPRAMERIDTDKDGKISDAEWEAARAEMQNRRGGPDGEKGPGKAKKKADDTR
jgi:hypothetical protein